MTPLTQPQQHALTTLLTHLIDQAKARIIIRPNQPADGYWFGGGQMVQGEGGLIWLSGRYRNYGDSRTGLGAGERGLECAIFCSEDDGHSFRKVSSWSKADLSAHGQVLSIEGTTLHKTQTGTWELFISMEKEASYPDALADYQKPGTGVWQIDRLTGPSPGELNLETQQPVLVNQTHPEYLHVKDPYIIPAPNGQTRLGFCSHPFSWSSSNSGLALRRASETGFQVTHWELARRGPVWDVAATRITSCLPVPAYGLFAKTAPATIYFYDGAECIRPHEQNKAGVSRPRGYSCEELGGALFGWDEAFPTLERLSLSAPLFVSPWGSGSSRYASALVTEDGILATWQQAQADGSQPLVLNFLPLDEVKRILAG